MFEYFVDECLLGDLSGILNSRAQDGWRLVSVTPVAVRGQAEVDTVRYAIVMELFTQTEDESEDITNSGEGGMAMRG